MPFKNPHPLYSVWQGMRRRCLTPTYKQWSDYGGRGISICPEWDSFHQFVADMGERPQGTSIDRIDNDGPYAPWNCRWATRLEQSRNQRTTKRVEIDGKSYLVCELANKYGLKHETIEDRANKGMSFEQTVKKTRYTDTSGLRKATMVRVSRQLSATHCKRGHEWTPENTGIQTGGRFCKECRRMRSRSYA